MNGKVTMNFEDKVQNGERGVELHIDCSLHDMSSFALIPAIRELTKALEFDKDMIALLCVGFLSDFWPDGDRSGVGPISIPGAKVVIKELEEGMKKCE